MTTASAVSPLAAYLTGYNADRWSDWVPVGDGTDARVRTAPDLDTSLQDYPDCFGTFAEVRRDGSRPSGFNGAARKIRHRGGVMWWQPPADLTAADLPSVAKAVEGYYLEDWAYIGVWVEVRRPPCPCCGARKTDTASLWGIESNSDASYFDQVVSDLLADLCPRKDV